MSSSLPRSCPLSYWAQADSSGKQTAPFSHSFYTRTRWQFGACRYFSSSAASGGSLTTYGFWEDSKRMCFGAAPACYHPMFCMQSVVSSECLLTMQLDCVLSLIFPSMHAGTDVPWQ